MNKECRNIIEQLLAMLEKIHNGLESINLILQYQVFDIKCLNREKKELEKKIRELE